MNRYGLGLALLGTLCACHELLPFGTGRRDLPQPALDLRPGPERGRDAPLSSDGPPRKQDVRPRDGRGPDHRPDGSAKKDARPGDGPGCTTTCTYGSCCGPNCCTGPTACCLGPLGATCCPVAFEQCCYGKCCSLQLSCCPLPQGCTLGACRKP